MYLSKAPLPLTAAATMASPPAPPLPVAPCFHTTDELMLYELAVTAVDHDIDFIDRAFREAHGGRGARHLREDFCGTALLASEWVLRDARRTAVGVDTCARTLEWGRRRNVERVADVAAARADGDSAHAARDALLERIELVCSDVCAVETSRSCSSDIIVAGNYSFFVFKQRAGLLNWLRSAHDGLAPGGMLFIEMIGGTGVMDAPSADPARRISVDPGFVRVHPMSGKIVGGRSSLSQEDAAEEDGGDGFIYLWEQKSYNPISSTTECAIHFRFDDGQELRDAFVYDWRIWTPVEVTNALKEVGFDSTKVLWEMGEEEEEEEDDDDGEAFEAVHMEKEEKTAKESTPQPPSGTPPPSAVGLWEALVEIMHIPTESERQTQLAALILTSNVSSSQREDPSLSLDYYTSSSSVVESAAAVSSALPLSPPLPPPTVAEVCSASAEIDADGDDEGADEDEDEEEPLDGEFEDVCRYVDAKIAEQQPSWNAWIVGMKGGGKDVTPWGADARADGRVAAPRETEEGEEEVESATDGERRDANTS